MRAQRDIRFWKCFLVAMVLWVAAAGCSRLAVIQNISHTHNVFVGGQAPTMMQVENSIVAAGATLGWTMVTEKPGRISGILDVRGKHHVEIRIDYDPQTYSITYLRSTGLKAEGGMIHRNYNRWIANLQRGIRTEQARMLRSSAR